MFLDVTEDEFKRIIDTNHAAVLRACRGFGDAGEPIGATLLLASAKAGAFITGIELVVDGGFNAMTS